MSAIVILSSAKTAARRSLHGQKECDEKFPEVSMAPPAKTGSFDCIVIRCANDNFAQDDKFGEEP